MTEDKKKKRKRNRKIGSRRDKDELIKLYRMSYNGCLKNLRYINLQLDEGKGLSDESQRFLKNADGIISSLANRIKSIDDEEKEERKLPPNLQVYADRLYTQDKIYKEVYGGKINAERYNDVYKQFDYVRCTFCNEMHKVDEECLWLKLAREAGIEVNDNLTKILNEPVDQDKDEKEDLPDNTS